MARKGTFLAASLASFLLAGGMLTATQARASVIFTGSGTIDGRSASASAEFAISGDTLTLTLTNTSPANSKETPGNTLSGVLFTLNGADPLLTPVSAISPNAVFQPSGCSVSCAGTNVNVGGEWGYQKGFSNGSLKEEAIASAGYLTTGIPGNIGNFNNGSAGTNLAGPDSLDGIQFGILSATHGSLNGGLSGEPLLMNSVVLTLKGVSGFSESQIGNVVFQYGTKASEAKIAGTPSTPPVDPPPVDVPEVSSIALLATGLLALAFGGLGRRSRFSSPV